MGSLRRQSMLLTVISLAICMAIGAVIIQYVMERSMREFEQRDAERTLDRISVLLDIQLSNMRKQATDYAVWTTTYDFMESDDYSYIKENYSESIFDNLDIDYVFLLRPDGSFAMALFRANQLTPGATSIRHIANVKGLALPDRIVELVPKENTSKVGGILNLNGKQFIYGFSPILTNDGYGPSRGNMVFIRTLNKKRMDYLINLAQVNFVLAPELTKEQINIGKDFINSNKILLDTTGKPVADIIVDQQRPLKHLISTTRNFISVYALVMILIALLLVFLLFDRLVLRKIDALVENIFSIRQGGAIGKRLPTIGNQDLDRISSEVNHMLEDLSISHAKLQHEAFHDHLTGLGNRRLLLKKLDTTFRAVTLNKVEGFTLLLMDLDDFKDINDLYGHLAGDYVLKSIATRISERTSNPDLAVRLGGDEFAVLIQSSLVSEAEHLAKQILDAVSRPVNWDGISLSVKASIGIVIANSSADPDNKPIDWLRKADIAMYASKNIHSNSYLIFHPDLEINLNERKYIESELLKMIADESSEIWMQPILRLSDSSVFAFEVLSRWFHPSLGEIAPVDFIQIAEEIKLISAFDRSVIKRSCAQLTELRKLHSDLKLCINVSANTLMDSSFAIFIGEQIQLHSIPNGALMLEITETVLASDEAALINSITAIREWGVRFLIDDFGTGYSSLSRLNAMPLDYLKIDGSFLIALDENQDTICKTIIQMAHSLDMLVIAEGVETATQMQRLAELNCDFVQGFFLAKPMNLQQFTHYLQKI